MSDKTETKVPTGKGDDQVTVSKGFLDSLMARLDKVEKVDAGAVNEIVARTCNSCGQEVGDEGKCKTHPSESVNHIAIGRDPETGLKRPVIAKQTRA